MPDTGVQRDNPPRMEELLNVAARLFYEKGVKATSLAEIGDELGMNKASLYYYIKSKDDLLTRVIFRASQRLRDLAEGIAADTASPDQALERLIRTHCETILEHPNEFGTVICQRRYMSGNVLPEISDRERAYTDGVKSLITRGIDAGLFRPMQASVATQLVLDSINGVLRWYRPAGTLSRNQAIDEIVSFIRNALVVDRS